MHRFFLYKESTKLLVTVSRIKIREIKMALLELVPLEKVICVKSKVNLMATYTIINMKLTKLFDEVITEAEKGILPILEMHILLQSLKNVVFYDEIEGNGVLSELWKCLNQKLYTRGSPWSCEIILGKIKVLRNLIAHDIIINGSLIWYMNEEIKWELDSPIYVPLEI